NRRVHELDQRSTAGGGLERRLSLRPYAKMDPSTFDDDRFSPFRGVKEKRKLLSGFSSGEAFHVVQCTNSAIPGEVAGHDPPCTYYVPLLVWGQLLGLPSSSTMRCHVPGGSTCKVFKNSITAPCSYADSAVNACCDCNASPAWARIDSRNVVNCPW